MTYAEMSMALVVCADRLSDEELRGAADVMLALLLLAVDKMDDATLGMIGTACTVLLSEVTARYSDEPWVMEAVVDEMAAALRPFTNSQGA
jgi:hypothetical protein